ncbi:MAG: chemotaxis response regulator protein-glutamate methylesterase [Candidatus Thiodiazotropha sp.]|nr:chemotaxis response regulator protein-glutamate methylesterase [Candidatus Thiodiazotropha sp.]MCM8882331.1 chemotaxis response regulator protein-glutamate methylesterase [Candidatus Thiodiazotropha sp.]MCM8919615.1 chemotaxis response regulator protein-glutamate methylesterase [Candidatus Thiodiazotropha sp.]MCU7871257.1 chemotaxis response regulator protein-glutamate methylesterase [Candidatus Thiodiazotropha sp. (ex Lucinoma borealis)]
MSAKLRVLIVDDSAFFRNRISAALSLADDIEIVGIAANGEEAIERTRTLRPDVITMDVEMPVVDGISAVRKIMAETPTRILMFSALTKEGARETLDALDAGAMDFLPKDMSNLGKGFEESNRYLVERVLAVGHSRLSISRAASGSYRSQVSRPSLSQQATIKSGKRPELVAIGASTGGPVALRQVLSALPRNFPLPVMVAVHMPGSFTGAYAERLNSVCAIKVKEATDRTPLVAGECLIAPGGKQMQAERGPSNYQVRISEPLPGQIYHPSVDLMLTSVANSYKDRALGLILTGMGADGLQGAKQLKQMGSNLWSQDEKSCVVYGMPQAVEKAGLTDRVLTLDEIGPLLARI